MEKFIDGRRYVQSRDLIDLLKKWKDEARELVFCSKTIESLILRTKIDELEILIKNSSAIYDKGK